MILLSFDIEEFDVPNQEYGKNLSFSEQMDLSKKGTLFILQILKNTNVKATFFCTANFAKNAPEIIKKIVKQGHELASHGFYHSQFSEEDYQKSKDVLEQISGVSIKGFRMARMMSVNYALQKKAGYLYDSSLNPTFLPGRYNHFRKPRTFFKNKYLTILPASVSPFLRVPLFWLSFHNFPFKMYCFLAKKTLRKDGYLNIYFHPWEFIDLHNKKFGLPFYFKKNSGQKMQKRLEKFIKKFQNEKNIFGRISDFLEGK